MPVPSRAAISARLVDRLRRLRFPKVSPRNATTATLPETVLVAMPTMGPPASFRMHTWSGADQIARELHTSGWTGFEPPVPDVFARCVRADGGLVLDVGANTGFYSLLAVSASETAVVHAFEPYPAAMRCLEENLRLNAPGGQGRVVALAEAVSDEVGDAVLYVPDPSHGLVETSCSLNGDFKEVVVDELRVRVVTLDAHLEGRDRLPVSVLKIDVESLEHKVLAGARRLLSDDRPIVFLEVLPSGDPGAVDRIRAEHGYVAVRLRPDSAVVGGAVAYDDQGWNQALVPEERVDAVMEILAAVPLRAVGAGDQA